MLVNTSWLLEYLEPKCSESDLLKALVSIGLEIEAYHPLAEELEDIIVGFIREKTPISGAEGMYICRADIQKDKSLQVVCASEHPIEIGWGVPIAVGPTTLPTGIAIKRESFHGVLSEGMICLDGELGMLARGSGLQVFHDEPAAIGQKLVDLIDIPDTIIDLKVTANRPDCLGLIGMAREVAAVLGLSLKLPPFGVEESDELTKDLVDVNIEEPSLCRRYMCRVIKGVSIAKSPAWLSSRLKSTGSKPINNVVDVTNFVMREWAQPLHAFDLHTLNGPQIIVRKMRPSESIELIDGKVVSGEKMPLVIADAERPAALAGIMGGRETQINDETVDVLLEAANFDSIQIKKSLKELDIKSTDASDRFQRGMDPNETLEKALERAASLIVQVAGGTITREPLDMYVNKLEPREFHLTSNRVNSYLGTNLSESTIKDCFERLGMRCSDELVVEVPTWRTDANNQVVLIEDVARLTGYDHIPLKQPNGNLTSGKRNALDSLRQKVTMFLANNGFLETRNIALESPQLISQFTHELEDTVKLANYSKEDMSVLRKSLLPGLIETISRNMRREVENFRYFELDRTFRQSSGETIEKWMIAAVAGGLMYDIDWSVNKPKIDFFHLKGVVEILLESLGITQAYFQAATHPGFTEGQTAEIKIGENIIGVIGAISKELLTPRKIKESIYGFELNLESLLKASAGVKAFTEPPRMPPVVRDIAMVFDNSVLYSEIEKRIREVATNILEDVGCIDIYEGKHIQQNSRSVSVRLRFRDAQRTLSTDEVSLIVEHIIRTLEKEYGAKLR